MSGANINPDPTQCITVQCIVDYRSTYMQNTTHTSVEVEHLFLAGAYVSARLSWASIAAAAAAAAAELSSSTSSTSTTLSSKNTAAAWATPYTHTGAVGAQVSAWPHSAISLPVKRLSTRHGGGTLAPQVIKCLHVYHATDAVTEQWHEFQGSWSAITPADRDLSEKNYSRKL